MFRGRGEHPKQGMVKRRIMPEDVIINCSKVPISVVDPVILIHIGSVYGNGYGSTQVKIGFKKGKRCKVEEPTD